MLKDSPFRVKIFLGPHQHKVPVALAEALQSLGENAEYITIEGAGNNALDFHIAYYIGALAAEYPSARFYVISRDSGYDPLLKHLENRNILARRSVCITDIPYFKRAGPSAPSVKVDPQVDQQGDPKPAPLVEPHVDLKLEAKVKEVVANLGRQASKPRTQKTLLNALRSLFRKRLTPPQLAMLFYELCRRGIVRVEGANVSYCLPAEQ